MPNLFENNTSTQIDVKRLKEDNDLAKFEMALQESDIKYVVRNDVALFENVADCKRAYNFLGEQLEYSPNNVNIANFIAIKDMLIESNSGNITLKKGQRVRVAVNYENNPIFVVEENVRDKKGNIEVRDIYMESRNEALMEKILEGLESEDNIESESGVEIKTVEDLLFVDGLTPDEIFDGIKNNELSVKGFEADEDNPDEENSNEENSNEGDSLENKSEENNVEDGVEKEGEELKVENKGLKIESKSRKIKKKSVQIEKIMVLSRLRKSSLSEDCIVVSPTAVKFNKFQKLTESILGKITDSPKPLQEDKEAGKKRADDSAKSKFVSCLSKVKKEDEKEEDTKDLVKKLIKIVRLKESDMRKKISCLGEELFSDYNENDRKPAPAEFVFKVESDEDGDGNEFFYIATKKFGEPVYDYKNGKELRFKTKEEAEKHMQKLQLNVFAKDMDANGDNSVAYIDFEDGIHRGTSPETSEARVSWYDTASENKGVYEWKKEASHKEYDEELFPSVRSFLRNLNVRGKTFQEKYQILDGYLTSIGFANLGKTELRLSNGRR
jgi:hypothetical protein